jgi:hypothetical protein
MAFVLGSLGLQRFLLRAVSRLLALFLIVSRTKCGPESDSSPPQPLLMYAATKPRKPTKPAIAPNAKPTSSMSSARKLNPTINAATL